MAIGKVVAEHLYIHVSALQELEDQDTAVLIRETLALLPPAEGAVVNVAKVHLRSRAVSLLSYPYFEDDPFPRLSCSWSRASGDTGVVTRRSYEDSSNPPILHRKELMVSPNHPSRDAWSRLTEEAKEWGLFDESATIGFALNWERLIASKGLQILGGQLIPLGNDTSDSASSSSELPSGPIERHRTALSRQALSVPIQLLTRHGLLEPSQTFFDYGCGRGGDMTRLREEGYAVGGWDPYFAPASEHHPADVVNLGFVINVIEDPAERVEALRSAFHLTRKVLSVGVMLAGSSNAGQTFGDGLRSSRNTFQKYFTQKEIKDYVETVLEREAHPVGPGVVFVFSDAAHEEKFLARRYRSQNVAPRLLARQRVRHSSLEQFKATHQALLATPEAQAALDRLWLLALDLGRLPDEMEASSIGNFLQIFPSYKKALRTLAQTKEISLLEQAEKARKDDLDVYFALLHFTRKADRKNSDPVLQRDIRHFYGTVTLASEAGNRLLRTAAVPASIYEACHWSSEKGLGWLTEQSHFQLEAVSVDRLPAVLRIYIACALQLSGSVAKYQLVKIHIASGKVSFLDYQDYDSPLPLLRRRLKVDLRRQDLQLFEYGSPQFPMPILHQKSRFMSDESEGYAEQISFDERLENLGLADARLGADELLQEIRYRRLEISGRSLRPSTEIPALSERCGKFLRFQDLIHCGETQHRLGVANTPLRADSYNALYELATHVLDPVIEYFGAIKLTYGFCSAELQKHIKSRVAPKLDQHAAAELNARGHLICPRGGAACDFLVEDEDMAGVAEWIIENLPFDRLYFYGKDRAVHVSYGPEQSRLAYEMIERGGKLVPREYKKKTS